MAVGNTNKWTPPQKSGGIPRESTIFSLSMGMSRLTRGGRPSPSRETKFSGANGNREIVFIFPVQVATGRIGNLNRLIHTLGMSNDILYSAQYRMRE